MTYYDGSEKGDSTLAARRCEIKSNKNYEVIGNMNIMSLLNALPGAVAQGLIWGIMAIGVYITFRIH